MLLTDKAESKSESSSPKARSFRAPGRVNLIGEHTDYNDGFVMPAAIGFTTTVTITPRADRTVSVFSTNFSERIDFDLDDRNLKPGHHWSDYVRGVAVALELAGHRLNGADLTVKGDVPIGSGLSSSAAIEVATALALLENAGLRLDRVEIARICQRAENDFVGTRCGIMDQFTSCCAQEGKALLLDCRSLEYKLLPLPESVRLVICNTMVRHALATGEYNKRRADCERGVSHFAKERPDVRALRDVTETDLEAARVDLPETIYRRCRHVITENTRVLGAASALKQEDLKRFGHLMNESHRSLRDDYEVSCAELDLMVQLAQRVPGVFGARMTGGGFGGCTINLVGAESVDLFKREVAEGYQADTGLVPEIYVCSAAAGAEETTSNEHV
jgi:galactokinase